MTSATTAPSGSRWTPALILLLIALAIRVWDFGNPVIKSMVMVSHFHSRIGNGWSNPIG